MKKLLIILTFCYSGLSFASETCSTSSSAESVEEQKEIKTDVPKYLKGATITVRLADGRESTVPAEQFKVVPRKQQFIVTKTKQSNKTVCSNDPNKNRLALLAGQGPQEGLNREQNGTTVSVESKVGAVGGLQYQRLITDRLGLGIQLQTNKTTLGSISLDF